MMAHNLDSNYLLNKHVSTKNNNYGPSIFNLERYTNEWTLMPLNAYFKRAYIPKSSGGLTGSAGVFQLDKFILSSSTNTKQGIPSTKKAPHSIKASTNRNIYLPNANNIKNFNFTSMSGIHNQKLLTTTAIHNYNHKNKQFNIEIEENDVEKSREVFTNDYINFLFGDTEGIGTNFLLTNTKKTQKNINHKYSVGDSAGARIASGRNRIIKAAIFLNNSIQFECKGSTHRRAGRFISLDREDNYKDSNFEHKMLGQYLTTSVQHVFTENLYSTRIIATKPYTFKNLKFKEDIE